MLTTSPTIRSIQRRNAIIPLPLLPPVPSNTIVTSVRIVHNQFAPESGFLDSGTAHEPHIRGFSNSHSPQIRGFSNAHSPPQIHGISNSHSPPPSPTPTNLCFAPLTGGAGKRLRSGRRRSSCTPCPPCQPPPDNNYDSSLLNPNRKPRSTIVVTVRLANPPPSNASYGSRNPSLVPGPHLASPPPPDGSDGSGTPTLVPVPRRTHQGGGAMVLRTGARQPPDRVIGVGDAFGAMQARRLAHRPRVSSPLASFLVTLGDDPDRMGMDPHDISPLSSPVTSCFPLYVGDTNPRRYTRRGGSGGGSKKSSKGKNGGRIGMLRWAVLNNSGPEVGRRILSMGPKLAKEIWEAEHVVEEIEAVESNEMEVMEYKHEKDVEVPNDRGEQWPCAPDDCEEQRTRAPDDCVEQRACAPEDCEDQRTREQLAEECIRELEEMEVDSEDIEMEQSSTLEAITTEKATETPQIENNNNNRMDLDMPAPVAVVTPLSTARQVQIQVEIAVQVFSPAKKAQKDAEKSKRWFERIAL